MALTPEQIKDEASHHGFIDNTDQLVKFARAIEAEVRKQDEALIRQLVDALEGAQKHHSTTSLPLAIQNFGSPEACGQFGTELWRKRIPAVITAGRTRLEGKP